MSIARIAETIENPSVPQLLAAYPTKDAFDTAFRAGKIKRTQESGVVANIFNRIVDDALAKQAQVKAQTTVMEDLTAPRQPMGLVAAAQPQQPQMPQRGGQGLDQVPVPENMFERQGMAGGGIVAFQAGGATPSFANMFQNLGPDLEALAAARRAYMGDFPMESAEDRKRELLAQLAVQFGGTLASTPGSFAEGLGAGARSISQPLMAGLSDLRKDRMARLAAERAEKGEVFEGVLSSRREAAKLASEEQRADRDREAKIIAAGIANQKPTDMQRFADLKVKASKGDKEAQLMVNAITNEYLPALGTSGLKAQAAMTSAEAGAEGKALSAYKEARETVDRMLSIMGPDKKLKDEYKAIKDPAEREAFIDRLVQKEMARAKAATEAFTAKGSPGGQPGAAAPKKPEISGVTGAPEGSSIGQFVSGKGWEVKDKSGKVIGYAQQ